MLEVNNRQVIKNLSDRTMKANKMRNIIAIIAVALTAIMFTTLFTIGTAGIKTMENSTCMQVGTNSHGGFKSLTWSEYKKIKESPAIKSGSYNIFVGSGRTKSLSKIATEFRYAQDENAKSSFSYPEVGTMPKKYRDVAMADMLLEKMGLSKKLGQKIRLSFEVNGEMHTDTFTLSGYWKANEAAMAQEVWLSKAYAMDITPYADKNFAKAGSNSFKSAGYLAYDFNFSNTWNLEKKIDQVIADAGLKKDEVNSGANWAYTTSEVDLQTILLILSVLVMIIFSGYLIIFNVFYISVARDIQFYGLLKTIGTTGRQIKRMVRRQAMRIGCIGVPLGLILGYLLGRYLTPIVMNQLNYRGDIVMSANPLIFIGAAAFSFITVIISCLRPEHMAAKVSPMEALRFNEAGSKLKKHKKSRKSRKVSVVSMAAKNVMRNKKRTIVVVLSLSLSVILLQSVLAIITGFDVNKYVEDSIATDFAVANTALDVGYDLSYVDGSAVTIVESLDGAKAIGKVYMQETSITYSKAAIDKIKELSKNHKESYDYRKEPLKEMEQQGKNSLHIYGVNKAAFDYLNLGGDDLTYEEFEKGNMALAYNDVAGFLKKGNKVTADYGDGITKTYTIADVKSITYCVSCIHSHGITDEIIVPEKEYLKYSSSKDPMRLIFNADKQSISRIDSQLNSYCDATDMNYSSRQTLIEFFEKDINMYKIIGGVLIGILGIIGIMNFSNTEITSIFARRKELAMIQSVGMTGKQLKKMLVSEGLLYAFMTLIISMTVGSLISKYIVELFAGQIWFFTYHFSLTGILIAAPLLIVICWLVPELSYRTISRETLVERLNTEE